MARLSHATGIGGKVAFAAAGIYGRRDRAGSGAEAGVTLGRDAGETRVLLVEDEPLIREVTAEVLSSAGFDVIATCTADEAAILLAEESFTILLTDVLMPGQIDGIGLAQHARELYPGMPVVFVSGRPDGAVRAGPIGEPKAFFTKPYDPDALVGAVERMSERAGAA